MQGVPGIPEGPAASTGPAPSVFSMRDLLASCAAATAVSTPPRPDLPQRSSTGTEGRAGRDAA
ncbi:hypothetical protein [Streptomyces jumonjinensis]|uniref:hypothetical protein n=1 Tax=Streptomyces jumonjinensis TaxID=1945 RepID=UPI0037B0C4EF